MSDTHRHQSISTDGYSDRVLSHVNDEYVKSGPAFWLAHRRDPRALRWRDYERDWNLVIPETILGYEYSHSFGLPRGLNHLPAASRRSLRRGVPYELGLGQRRQPTSGGKSPNGFVLSWRRYVTCCVHRGCSRTHWHPRLCPVVSSSGTAFQLPNRAPARI